MWKKEIIHLYQQEETAKVFDDERSRYAYQRYKHKFESKILKNIIKEFPSQSIRVLDVACGTGRMVPEIFDTNKKIKYTGLDTSKTMIGVLREKIKSLKKEKEVTLIYSDATKMPFKDNSFDVCYTYHLLWHIPKEDQEKVIKEMIRVTRKDGTILFDVLNSNFIFDKFKKFIGRKNREGLYKFSVSEINEIIGKRDKKVEKLLDIPIKNSFVYGIFNVLNKLNKFFATTFFHMLYFNVKK